MNCLHGHNMRGDRKFDRKVRGIILFAGGRGWGLRSLFFVGGGGAPHLDLRMIKTNNYLSLRSVFWPLSSGL